MTEKTTALCMYKYCIINHSYFYNGQYLCAEHYDYLLKEKFKNHTALKNDDSKTQWNLLYYPTFEKLCEVMKKGSEIYGFENWKKPKKNKQMFQNAIMRHWVEIQKGIWIDSESNLPHIIHIMANCMMEDYHHE